MRGAQPGRYTAYGHVALEGNLQPSLGFNGERVDWLLKTYFLGNGRRHYSPGMMRFLSPDGLSPFAAGGMNAYAYCAGDPVNFIDPTGKSRKSGMSTLRGKTKFNKSLLRKSTNLKAPAGDAVDAVDGSLVQVSKKVQADRPGPKSEWIYTNTVAGPRLHKAHIDTNDTILHEQRTEIARLNSENLKLIAENKQIRSENKALINKVSSLLGGDQVG